MNAAKAPLLLPVAGRPARGKAACLALLVAAVAWSILLSTARMMPLVWDEGDSILRAAAIPRQFEYTITREGHPAGYGLVIRLGQAAADGFCSPLVAWRLGPITLFAAALGAVCYRLARDLSWTAALGATAAVFCMPRLFAHAHFASFDGPLTACWLISWVVYATWIGRLSADLNLNLGTAGQPAGLPNAATEPTAAARKRPPWRLLARNGGPSRMPAGVLWAIAAGAALGATMSCKATGWLAAAPPIIWSLVCWIRAIRSGRNTRVNPPGSDHSKGGNDQAALARRMALGTFGLVLPAALATFIALNPPLWRQPIEGLLEFWRLNLHRGEDAGLNIATQFFGRLYNLDHPLPWYNTIVWTAVTVPLGILGLAGLGLVSLGFARRYGAMCDAPSPGSAVCDSGDRGAAAVGRSINAYGGLLLGHWSILLIVRALPGVPPHDAERLILPSFAFLAVLCGLGTDLLWRWAVGGRRRFVQTAVAAVFAVSAFPTYWFAPQWLSYYNPLVGGLPGAVALGLEPTYYWDSFDREVIDWLNAHTAPDERVLLLAAPDDNLALLRQWGVVQFETDHRSPLRLRWVVVQHRPSGWQPDAMRLITSAQPVLTKRLGRGGWGPWRLDVPLLTIYDAADYVDATPLPPH